MNTSVGIASLLLGLSVTIALPAGPAAAGRESARTTAATHTQGRSASDPDGLSNGGADKPGHTGGFTSDRDGNNGCGNDDDREDDNNGWCGRLNVKRAKPARPEAAPASMTVAASSAGATVAATVLAGAESAAAGAEAAGTSDALAPSSDPTPASPVSDPAPAPSDPAGAEVLGAQEERGASGGPASLPRTGAGLLVLGAAGAALAGAGATLRRFSRRS